jgi:hypothetical protein
MTSALLHVHTSENLAPGELREHVAIAHGVSGRGGPWLSDRNLVANWHDQVHQDAEMVTFPVLTRGELRSMLLEGFHTAFRKATDDPLAMPIHRLISQLEDGEFRAVGNFVIDGMEGLWRDEKDVLQRGGREQQP